jgi:hypothetical protein
VVFKTHMKGDRRALTTQRHIRCERGEELVMCGTRTNELQFDGTISSHGSTPL